MANTWPPPIERQALLCPYEHGVRVLVVDDYADIVDSMAMLLRLYGHQVETALGGSAALRAARANPPTVALLDLSMPEWTATRLLGNCGCMFQIG